MVETGMGRRDTCRMTRKTQAQWHRQEQRNADRTGLRGRNGDARVALEGQILRSHIYIYVH